MKDTIDMFPIVKRKDAAKYGEYCTERVIETGAPYEGPALPEAGWAVSSGVSAG